MTGTIAYISTRPQPNFQVMDISLSSNEVVEGESVTAEVRVANGGDVEGSKMIEVELDNELFARKEVTLRAGESRTVDFVITKQLKGTYNLQVGDLSRTFEVMKPAKFDVSNLKLSSAQVTPNEPIVVSLVVSNRGDLSGEYTAGMEINGILENSETVVLDGGENTTLSFRVRKEEIKSYQLNISGLSKTFKVVPNYTISNLRVSPTGVEPGENVSISVEVNNLSNEEGTYTVSLDIDGDTEKSKDVTVLGGNSTTITFTTSKQQKKTYSVEIGGLTQSFEVGGSAKFKIIDFNLASPRIVLKEKENISLKIKNVGNLSGYHTYVLRINGKCENIKSVFLEGGENKIIRFETLKKERGTYSVEIGGLKKEFEVITTPNTILNGGFEEKEEGDPSPYWKGIRGTGWTYGSGGYIGGFTNLYIWKHGSEMGGSSIWQEVYFVKKELNLNFWIRPQPERQEIKAQVLLDNHIIFNELYSGPSSQHDWSKKIIDLEKVWEKYSFQEGNYEVRLRVRPTKYYSDVKAHVNFDEISIEEK